jgi:hypothetical protein
LAIWHIFRLEKPEFPKAPPSNLFFILIGTNLRRL